jgi:hypothetical protein
LAIRKQNDGTLKQKIYKAVKAGDHNKIATTIKDFLSKWRPLSNDLTAATDKFDSTKTSPEMLR